MKKVIIVLISFITLFTITGCSNSVEYDEVTLQLKAKELVSELVIDNYDSTVDLFNKQMQKLISKDELKQIIDKEKENLGAHIEHHSVEGEVDGKYYKTYTIEKYENSGFQYNLTFDSNNEIAGISIKPVSIPEVSDLFTEESVNIGEYNLDGKLTLPKNVVNPKVVLLVQGSGATDMNEQIYLNTPLKDIAYALAEEGIASLRYNKRFYQYNNLGQVNHSIDEEILDDVNSAIDFLETNNKVDSDNIYVLGHSQGAMLTPKIATDNTSVKGIISMAGSLRELYEISYDQNKAIEANLDNSNYTEEEKEIIRKQMVQVEKDIITLRGDVSNLKDNNYYMGFTGKYQKTVAEYAGKNYIEELNIPILVLQGTSDFQITVEKDYQSWLDVSKDNISYKLYDGLNHLMMKSSGINSNEDYKKKQTVDTNVLTDIINFIK